MTNEKKAFKLTPQEFISLYQSNPKPINNESKAEVIAENNLKWYYEAGNSYEECYQSALQAMQWKDEQQWKPTEKQLDALYVYVITRSEEHADYVEECFLDEKKAQAYCEKFNKNENEYSRDITKIKITL